MAKALNFIVILLVGFLLAVPHAVLAQGIDEATALSQQVIELYKKERYSEAVSLAERALAIYEKGLGLDHPDVATALYNLAEVYRSQGRYVDAEPLFKRALGIQEKVLGPNHLEVAQSLNNLAILYKQQGRYADAEPLYKRSLAIRENALGPNHPDVAQSLGNLADLHSMRARFADAEPLYKRSLAIRESALGPDHPDVAATLNNLAILYMQQGRFADAEPLYKRSLAIEEVRGPDNLGVARALNNLAILYQDESHYADAELFYKRSLAIREKLLGPDHPDVAELLNNLAALYGVQGRNTDAEPLYKRSLAIKEKTLGEDDPSVATTLIGLGKVYTAQGHYAYAEPLYRRSLAIQERALGPHHPSVTQSLSSLAGLYYTQGRYAEAEPLYKRSLAISEMAFGDDHADVAVVLSDLAALEQAQGRYTEAEPLYKRSLAIFEKALGQNHPWFAHSLNNLASLYVYEGRYAEALRLVRAAAQNGFPEKSTYLAALTGAVTKSIITDADAFNEGYQIVQRLTSTAVSNAVNQLAARFATGNDQLAQLVRREQDLSVEIERLDKVIVEAASKEPSRRDAANEQQIRNRLQAAGNLRAEIDTALHQQFPNYAALTKPEPLSVQETQQLLADDEALIVFDFDRQSYAAVFTRSDAQAFELKITAGDLAAQIRVLRNSLNFGPRLDVEASYRLYHSLVGPFADFVSSKKRLSVVTNGALSSLPLQLLVTTDPTGEKRKDIDWLVRKYAITVLPSTASLKILRERKMPAIAAKPMIGFGDPVFDRTVPTATERKVAILSRSLPEFYRGLTVDMKSLAEALMPLPETADELRAVAKALGARSEDVKLGEAATVTDVKHEPLDEYRVVYFATHALVAGEVEKFAKVKAEPSLVLSIPEQPTEEDDGLLRASAVATLKMNADFVVLSACNTAAGDNPGAEALSGLARAFFYAGARSLIVSNWEVDSESTVALMTGLFDAVKSNPHLSHAEALRLSMLQMIDHPSKPEWAQPKFWAPFVVVGEPQKN